VPRGLERFRIDVLQKPPNPGNDRGIPDSAEGLYVQYLRDEKVAGLRAPDSDWAGNRMDAAEVELLDVLDAIRVLQLIVVLPDALQTDFTSGRYLNNWFDIRMPPVVDLVFLICRTPSFLQRDGVIGHEYAGSSGAKKII